MNQLIFGDQKLRPTLLLLFRILASSEIQLAIWLIRNGWKVAPIATA